ncbi:hypothetical protein [Heyndrickxia acidicola]|uniref:Uncharacterized protein n=1 Tax=Heyndrickxia acidicola TaxID=209389 RepID=A0ABU6MLC7_9BACI|nr:hypothetical protein [Heyndrickxia acidicola]MED1205325.1 hypothetical protein [Heyndrickxia acidicola]
MNFIVIEVENESTCNAHQTAGRTGAQPITQLKLKVELKPKLIEAKGTRLLREKPVRGDPAVANLRRGGSPTARGKRVPAV